MTKFKVTIELPGVGDIFYEYKNGILNIKIPGRKDIVMEQMVARRVFNEALEKAPVNYVENAKSLAADITGITDPSARKRSVNHIWARYIIWYELVKYHGFSYKKAGQVVGRTHSTAINGFKAFTTPTKYLTQKERVIKAKYNRFVSKINFTH